MWENIREKIFKLFGARSVQSEVDIMGAARDARAFEDVKRINFTAVFANALSTLAFSDSSVEVQGGEYLSKIAKNHWKTMKQNIALGNGTGMIASVPYIYGDGKKIGIDTICKERFIIKAAMGGEITAIAALSDVVVLGGKRYLRFTDYSLEGTTYIIRHKAVLNGEEIPLNAVPQWANIQPEVKITGCERLPIGIYRCPTSDRRAASVQGVPLTYGCGETIEKIHECLAQIEGEFKEKGVKIFADTSLFSKEDKLSKIYKTIRSGASLGAGGMIEVFDPAFRDSALYGRLEHLMAQLEKEVGTGRGILTDLSVGGGTATEIRRATFATFSLCDDIHLAAQEYFDGLMYGAAVLLSAMGIKENQCSVSYNWSYAMLEDTSETFSQLMQAHSIGAVTTQEIRQFVMPEPKNKI